MGGHSVKCVSKLVSVSLIANQSDGHIALSTILDRARTVNIYYTYCEPKACRMRINVRAQEQLVHEARALHNTSNSTHARNISGTEPRRSLLNLCKLVSLKAVATAKEPVGSLCSVTMLWSTSGSTLVGFPTLLLNVGVLHRSCASTACQQDCPSDSVCTSTASFTTAILTCLQPMGSAC